MAGPRTVDEYIVNFPPETREALELVRDTILQVVPGASEAIKYGMPTVVYKGNLVHYAAYAKHIGLYAIPNKLPEFVLEMAQYKTGSGSVQFPLNKPMPLDLIRSLVEYRVRQSEGEGFVGDNTNK